MIMGKEQVRLIKPSKAYKDAYLAFYEDWVRSGELMVPWVISKDPYAFDEMLAFCSVINKGSTSRRARSKTVHIGWSRRVNKSWVL